MAISITKPLLGAVSGWGAVLNQALDDIVTALNAQSGTSVPTVGSYAYNPDGTVATDPDGNAYSYNPDGTVRTITKGGVTRTLTYNADGTVGSVA